MSKTWKTAGATLALSIVFGLLAGGCAAELTADGATRVRAHYEAMDALTLTATLRTDFGNRVTDFSVDYEQTGENEAMTVTAPEDIAGIRATLTGDGATLTYEDVALELGALPGTGHSPMETLPFMVRQWKLGYAVQTGFERKGDRQLLLVVYRSTQGGTVLEQKALFDPETLAPVTSELSVDGTCVVYCTYGSEQTTNNQ